MAAPVEIRISRSPGERRVALLRDGVLVGFRIERPAQPDGVGDILRGRVESRQPALAGGFVALPGGASGFLPESECDGRRLPDEGSWLTLRVTRAAQNGKGLRLSARLPQRPGTGLALLERGPDQARRWIAAFPDAPRLCDDAPEAARLGARHAPAFDDALEAEAEALASRAAPIPGGGRLIISPLPALTAIDCDAPDPREANRRALPELARQVALRDLAGPILLDLAGLSLKQRQALDGEIRAALGRDPLVQALGFGPLGLFEFRRARIHPPLHEVLADAPLARGLTLLRRAARERDRAPHRRLALHAPAPVLAAIRAMPGALEEFAGPLALRESSVEEIADA